MIFVSVWDREAQSFDDLERRKQYEEVGLGFIIGQEMARGNGRRRSWEFRGHVFGFG